MLLNELQPSTLPRFPPFQFASFTFGIGEECQCFARYSLSLKKFPISMTIWHQKRRNGTKAAKGVRRSECHRIHLQMRLCALTEALGAHKSCLLLFLVRIQSCARKQILQSLMQRLAVIQVKKRITFQLQRRETQQQKHSLGNNLNKHAL